MLKYNELKEGILYRYIKGNKLDCDIVMYSSGFIFNPYIYQPRKWAIVNIEEHEIAYEFTNVDCNIDKINEELRDIYFTAEEWSVVDVVETILKTGKISLSNFPIAYLDKKCNADGTFHFKATVGIRRVQGIPDKEDLFSEIGEVYKLRNL